MIDPGPAAFKCDGFMWCHEYDFRVKWRNQWRHQSTRHMHFL